MFAWLKSEYTRSLEAEVARLRQENRALVQSMLATAGFHPQLAAPPAADPQQGPAKEIRQQRRRTLFQWARSKERQDRIAAKHDFDARRAAELLAQQEKEIDERSKAAHA
jgi:hypothetical protein